MVIDSILETHHFTSCALGGCGGYGIRSQKSDVVIVR